MPNINISTVSRCAAEVLRAIAFLLLLTVYLPMRVHACASLHLVVNQDIDPVVVSEETAIIVWNPATHTESFIRSATFQTSAHDLGFLVPTPTVPKMAEADIQALAILGKATRPEVLTGAIYHYYPTSLIFISLAKFLGNTAASRLNVASRSDVDVLAEQQVAGMDATSLAASDANALAAWIAAHGYAWSPDLASWLKPYVDKGWTINAFKYSKSGASSGQVVSKLINMTFATDTPYFPYSEPSSARQSGSSPDRRSLRVFMLSSARMAGALAPNAAGVTWPGKTDYAAPMPAGWLKDLTGQLGVDPGSLSSGTWVTAFTDVSSPRPGVADLKFQSAPDQSRVIPPPIDNRHHDFILVPVEIVTVPLLLLMFWTGGFRVNERNERIRVPFIVLTWACWFGNVGLILGMILGGILLPFVNAQNVHWRSDHGMPPTEFVLTIGIVVLAGIIYGARQGRQRIILT